MREIVLATRNRHKIVELLAILPQNTYHIKTMEDFADFPEVEEDGNTFQENAEKKALEIARFTGLAAIADDSGLVVEALDGAPGVNSAYFAGPNATDEENNRKLLALMAEVPAEKRKAYFVCVIAVADHNGEVQCVEGRCHGMVAAEPSGSCGFGYDPLFIPEGESLSYAEMPENKKNAISHRALALGQIAAVLNRIVGE